MNHPPLVLEARFSFTGTQLEELFQDFGLPDKLVHNSFLQFVKTQANLRWIFAEPNSDTIEIYAGADDEQTAAYAQELITARAQLVSQELRDYIRDLALPDDSLQMSTPLYRIQAWDDMHPIRRYLIRCVTCNDIKLADEEFRCSE